MTVGGRDIDLISDAKKYENITSCSADSGIQNDDPCLKLPCGSQGQCVSTGNGDFNCVCKPGYIGKSW